MMIICLLFLMFSAVPVRAEDTNWGTIHKVAVILGTLLGGLILAAVLGFLFYYICVRKWVSDFQTRNPESTRPQVYRAPPPPIQKDIPPMVYSHQQSFPPPTYTASPPPVTTYHKETTPPSYSTTPPPVRTYHKDTTPPVYNTSTQPMTAYDASSGPLNQSALTTSSWSSGGAVPVLSQEPLQTGAVSSDHYVTQYNQYRHVTTTRTATATAAAYTGSSV